jgi:hypothetical protein
MALGRPGNGHDPWTLREQPRRAPPVPVLPAYARRSRPTSGPCSRSPERKPPGPIFQVCASALIFFRCGVTSAGWGRSALLRACTRHGGSWLPLPPATAQPPGPSPGTAQPPGPPGTDKPLATTRGRRSKTQGWPASACRSRCRRPAADILHRAPPKRWAGCGHAVAMLLHHMGTVKRCRLAAPWSPRYGAAPWHLSAPPAPAP